MDRKIQPDIKRPDKIIIPKPEKVILDNGIPLYIINAGNEEVFRLEFVFKAGTYYVDNSINKLSANFTCKLLTEGTKSYSFEQISDILDFYSIYLDKDSNRDRAYITITGLNKYLDKILPVFNEILTQPSFPEKGFEDIKKRAKQKFLKNNEKVSYLVKHNFLPLLYGENHPYGYKTKEEDYDTLTIEELKNFHSRFYSSDNCFIIASGKQTVDVAALLNNHFNFRFGNPGVLSEKPVSILEPGNLIIEKKDSVQNAIRMGRVLFSYKHPDYFDFKILSTILGGYFGARLMSNLREDKGYTYGISSQLVPLSNSGFLFIGSQFSVDSDKFRKEIYKELMRLREEIISLQELDLVKNFMLGDFLRSLNGPFEIADISQISIDHNLPPDYFNDYIERIKNIKPEDITKIALKYLNPAEMSTVIAGRK